MSVEVDRKPGARRAWLAWCWSMRVGSVVPVGRTPGTIAQIDDYPPDPNRGPEVPIRPDYYARRWRTTAGDRWVSWHPGELPDTLPMEGLTP